MFPSKLPDESGDSLRRPARSPEERKAELTAETEAAEAALRQELAELRMQPPADLPVVGSRIDALAGGSDVNAGTELVQYLTSDLPRAPVVLALALEGRNICAGRSFTGRFALAGVTHCSVPNTPDGRALLPADERARFGCELARVQRLSLSVGATATILECLAATRALGALRAYGARFLDLLQARALLAALGAERPLSLSVTAAHLEEVARIVSVSSGEEEAVLRLLLGPLPPADIRWLAELAPRVIEDALRNEPLDVESVIPVLQDGVPRFTLQHWQSEDFARTARQIGRSLAEAA